MFGCITNCLDSNDYCCVIIFTAATASYRHAHLIVEIDFKVFNFKFIWFAIVSNIERRIQLASINAYKNCIVPKKSKTIQFDRPIESINTRFKKWAWQ